MTTDINTMISYLQVAKHQSADEPDIPPQQPTSLVYTGRPGRPRIEFDPDALATALQYRGVTDVGRMFNTSARTARRAGLQLGLLEPGQPVYVDVQGDDGQLYRQWTSSTGVQSDLTDAELDNVMREILQVFPTHGWRMLDGSLEYRGQRVPRRRIQESYSRVNGPNTRNGFGVRRIQRRVYRVTAFNSLVHHDGQHGAFHASHCSLLFNVAQVLSVGRSSSTHSLTGTRVLSPAFVHTPITEQRPS